MSKFSQGVVGLSLLAAALTFGMPPKLLQPPEKADEYCFSLRLEFRTRGAPLVRLE